MGSGNEDIQYHWLPRCRRKDKSKTGPSALERYASAAQCQASPGGSKQERDSQLSGKVEGNCRAHPKTDEGERFAPVLIRYQNYRASLSSATQRRPRFLANYQHRPQRPRRFAKNQSAFRTSSFSAAASRLFALTATGVHHPDQTHRQRPDASVFDERNSQSCFLHPRHPSLLRNFTTYL